MLLLRADFLQIKEVKVEGNLLVSKEAVEKVARGELVGPYFFVIPKSNYLFVKKDKITAKLLNEFSRLETVEVNKKINGTLEIKLTERQGDFVWCQGGEGACYSMNQNGLAFVEIGREEINGKIIFKNSLEEAGLLKSFAGEGRMQNYLKAIKILGDAHFEIIEINLVLSDKVIFKTNVGEIFLNPEEDLSQTAENAVILINEVKTKTPSALFEYIDARFGNKVFYKLR